MNNLRESNKKIEKAVVDGYKKIEDGVVSGYKKVESGVVGGYKKVEDKFIGAFFAEDGETVDEARARLQGNVQAEKEKRK